MAVTGSNRHSPQRASKGKPGGQCRGFGVGSVVARCAGGILPSRSNPGHVGGAVNAPSAFESRHFARDTENTPWQRAQRVMLARGITMPRTSASGLSSTEQTRRADLSHKPWSRLEASSREPFACEAAAQRAPSSWNTASGDQEGGAWDGLPAVPSFNRIAGVLRGLRVLVVEDDMDIRELLIAVLADAGAVVESAESAAQGLNAVACFHPQLLVSDIGMPGEDGYSFIRRVRALGAHAGGDIPSIALTAFSSVTDREKALGAGFTVHLSKPIDPIDLVCAVKDLAQRRDS
jgi:CheY-like chemotaxis protein